MGASGFEVVGYELLIRIFPVVMYEDFMDVQKVMAMVMGQCCHILMWYMLMFQVI